MAKGDKWLAFIGSIVGGGTTAWTSVNLLLDTSPDLVDASGSSAAEPGMASAGSMVVSTFAASSSGPDMIIEGPAGIIKLFFKNQVPYTNTEKRAEQVYNSLHNEGKKILERPMMITESGEAMETVSRAFCNARGDGILDRLELFEELLESVADNQNFN